MISCNNSLISIVVPAYNVAPYLRKCLDSVLAQTYTSWEAICVDDGSTDGSATILDEYAARDSRIRVIHQMNSGVSAARNAALAIVSGSWLQFLDGDDYLEPNFLDLIHEEIVRFPDADSIEHVEKCFTETQVVLGDNGRLPPDSVLSSDDILNDPYGVKYTNLARCVCFKVMRRSIIEKYDIRFVEGIPIGEDSLFATMFYACAKKIRVAPSVAGYCRIIHDGSAMASIRADKLYPSVLAAEKILDFWDSNTSLRRESLARKISTKIVSLFLLGKKYGINVRDACVRYLINNNAPSRRALIFVIKYGTAKGRMLSFAYYVSPKYLREKILRIL